jgi:hypothetical protein
MTLVDALYRYYVGYCPLSEVYLIYTAFQKLAVCLSSASDESNIIKSVLLDQLDGASRCPCAGDWLYVMGSAEQVLYHFLQIET